MDSQTKSARGLKFLALATVALLMVALLVASSAATAQADKKPSPVVFAPNSQPYGKSYGEWSALWWRWAYSLPVDGHPLFGEKNDCSAGQSGDVWFLGGTFTPGPPDINGNILGEATRHCKVPDGTALLIPILNGECSTIEGDGTTDEELRPCAQALVNATDLASLKLTVDGVPVGNLDSYRVESPLSTFGPLPENNLLGKPAGSTSLFVGDGFYVMMRPQHLGQHRVHFEAIAAGEGWSFSLDITYKVVVVPAK